MLSKPNHIRNALKSERWRFTIQGVVQGVGFRPFLHGLATDLGLGGWARNTSDGVEMVLSGPSERLERFEDALATEAPPLARVLDVSIRRETGAVKPVTGFRILPSRSAAGRTFVSPDVATCSACLDETLDPVERRFAYPFTNCTHCGPRFTIITDLPYDRHNTSMQGFPLCSACRSEYGRLEDRRFHAQPIACPKSGPLASLVTSEGETMGVPPTDVLPFAARMLLDGHILGVKGLGGFHIACLASSHHAVERLRRMKFRPSKPFALMVPSAEAAEAIATLSTAEALTLDSPEAPIVLLQKRPGALPDAIAPQNDCVGVMLPYTPLHHLLMRDVNAPMVFTSGNPQGEPLCIDPGEALERLGRFVDAFVMHDRPIVRPCDDSVVRVLSVPPIGGDIVQPVRRSRGYSPLPVFLPKTRALSEAALATGGDLKNVSAVGEGRSVFLSQHLGDLANLRVRDLQARPVQGLEDMFEVRPTAVLCDLHPGYASSQFGERYALERGLPVHRVQHHHAHIAGCLAEHGYLGSAIGFAYDGTGYGTDGQIWGGEILTVSGAEFQREMHLEYLPLPGGDAGTRHPHRIAIAYLEKLLPEGEWSDLFEGVDRREVELVRGMVREDVQIVQTSSLGRLFDAVAGLLALVGEVTHEGQGAIALESLANLCEDEVPPYPFVIEAGEIRLSSTLEAILEAVVFTDAGIGVSDVQLARVEPSIPSPSVGHHLTPNALLTYADRLYGQRPQAWLVTLPAFDLSYGDTLTRQAETGVSDAVTQVTALIESLVAPPVGAYAV